MPGVISCVTRARSGAPPRTQPQKRHARVLSTRRDASRDPFALKRCVLMRHLKTLGRATNLSSIKMHHIEHHTGREWRIQHPYTRTETLRMLTLAPPKRLPGPLCTQNVLTTYGTSESARISWTSEQPLAHQNASYRALHRS